MQKSTKKVIKFTLFVVSLIGTSSFYPIVSFFFVKMALTGQFNHLALSVRSLSSSDQKFTLLRELGVFFSIYLFMATGSVVFLRVVTGKAMPARNPDSEQMATINRIISNSIEQFIIFSGLFVYILYEPLGPFRSSELIGIATAFMIGRMTFAVGYMMASFTGISTCRAFGFMVGVYVNLLMAEAIFMEHRYLAALMK